MKRLLLIPILLFACINFAYFAYGDKGPVIWQKGVQLSQESQKAIILHNSSEEVLILGTELSATKDMQILEFIPFPAEPKVSLAQGAPFERIAKLIHKKGLVFYFARITKGGSGGSTVPVEIRLSEKIGLHDVTILKINDISQFSQWLDKFFKKNGIHADKDNLSRVYSNARDYVRRGIDYFVLDRVEVSNKVKFVEPLVYTFKSDKIYYPLKTSNLIGGKGVVELIMVLPGSVSEDIWQEFGNMFVMGKGVDVKISSSSKLHPEEVEAVYRSKPSPFFTGAAKIYLQVFRYSGPYNFRGDFTYDISKLVPYAYRYVSGDPVRGTTKFWPPFTAGEKRDFREAFCSGSGLKNFFFLQRYNLDCWGFIPNDEYAVYVALFRKQELPGIPWGRVVLEDTTVRKEYKGRDIDPVLQKAFNDKNKVGYPLEHVFPQNDKEKVWLRGDGDAPPLTGKTYISRVGFSKDGSRALVYVEHVGGSKTGVGYFTTLRKQGRDWRIVGFELDDRY